jgi:Short-chain alcohol dehydrogenase of unknown specificity
MTERQLSGSTALVTGASRGFGRAVAAALAKEGASVVGVARDAAALASVREQIGSGFPRWPRTPRTRSRPAH